MIKYQKNIIIPILATLIFFVINRASAVFDEEDATVARQSITVAQLHQYKDLYGSSSKARYLRPLFNVLSGSVKIAAGVTAITSGAIDVYDTEETETQRSSEAWSASFAFGTAVLVVVDGIWFQRSSQHYTDAPQKLRTFLEEIAVDLAEGRQKLSEKHQFLHVIGQEFERLRLNPNPERQPLHPI